MLGHVVQGRWRAYCTHRSGHTVRVTSSHVPNPTVGNHATSASTRTSSIRIVMRCGFFVPAPAAAEPCNSASEIMAAAATRAAAPRAKRTRSIVAVRWYCAQAACRSVLRCTDTVMCSVPVCGMNELIRLGTGPAQLCLPHVFLDVFSLFFIVSGLFLDVSNCFLTLDRFSHQSPRSQRQQLAPVLDRRDVS